MQNIEKLDLSYYHVLNTQSHTHKLSPSRKLHSTAVGTIKLSHDASVRMSDAANSSVRFSSSITYTTQKQQSHHSNA